MNFSDVHNYNENLVYEYVIETFAKERGIDDEELLIDTACLALNLLQARYVRHDVDMAFFLTPNERSAIKESIIKAVTDAYQRISSGAVVSERTDNSDG